MQLSDKFFTFDTGEKSHFFDIITSSGLSLSLFSIGASIQKLLLKVRNGPTIRKKTGMNFRSH